MNNDNAASRKVLMVGPGPKSPGGMLTVAQNYCDGFSSEQGVDVDYIGIGTRGSLPYKCAYFAKQYLKAASMLRRGGYDICHVHMGDKGGAFRSGLVVSLARRHGCKTVIHLHAGNMMLWYETLGKSLKGKVRKILNSGDVLIVLGELWRKQLSALVDPGKIRVVYNGVELSSLDKVSNAKVRFLYLGVLKKQKGLVDLLLAIEEARDRLEGRAEFIVAGKVFDLDVEKEVKARGLGGLVRCIGWADADAKRRLFAETDVAVLPSYWEGLPMSVLETMGHGIPNITTNVGAIPEVIDSGINGIVLEPGDVHALAKALVELTEDASLRGGMGVRAAATVAGRFSLEGQLAQTVEVYDELLGSDDGRC